MLKWHGNSFCRKTTPLGHLACILFSPSFYCPYWSSLLALQDQPLTGYSVKFRVVEVPGCFLPRWKADFPFRAEEILFRLYLMLPVLVKGYSPQGQLVREKKCPQFFSKTLKNGHNLICKHWSAEGPKEGPLSFEKYKSRFIFSFPMKETFCSHLIGQEFERKLSTFCLSCFVSMLEVILEISWGSCLTNEETES